jgi:hypothetical protein
MEGLGFKAISADNSVFVSDTGVVVAVYVDDLIIAHSELEKVTAVKEAIKKNWKVKDLGECSKILGMEWIRDRKNRSSFLTQEKYTNEVLERFKMADAKPVSTPGVNLEVAKEGKPLESSKIYMEVCGCLSHLQNCTRPDITYAVGMICREMQNPTEQSWAAVKRLLRYLKGTSSHGIHYSKNEERIQIVGYADADWAGCKETRKSTSGYIFLMANGAVSWASKKQAVVALSTVEAEYISGSLGVQEAIWEAKFLEEIGIKVDTPTLMQDNQGTIALAKNPIGHARTKHIDIRHYFMKSSVQDGRVKLEYCETKNMLADIMTKFLTKQSHTVLRESAGIKARM